MKALKLILDKTLEFILMVAVGLLVIDVLWQVLVNALQKATWFNFPFSCLWTEELAIVLLVWGSLLGAAVGLGVGAHLGIDYVVSKMKPASKRITEVVVFALVFLFSLVVMVVGGFDLTKSTFELGQLMPQLHMPQGYVYVAIPVSGVFMMIYSGIGFVERLAACRKGDNQ